MCAFRFPGRSPGTLLVLALASAAISLAQEYSFRFYGTAEGLQNLVVLSLAQDRAGFLWVGTEVGLYRYNGTRFRLMGEEEGLPCNGEVHALFVSSDGALWVNTCARIFRFDGQRFQAIPDVNILLRGSQVIADSVGGGVLIATETGIREVSRTAADSFSTRPYPLPNSLAGKPIHGILRHGSSLWFGCGQALCLEESGRISVFGKERGLPEDSWDAIQVSADGTVWVRSPKSVYRRGPQQARFSEEQSSIASSGFWGALALGRDGSIMIPTDQGLVIHKGAEWDVVNRRRGLRTENAAAVLEDREGSVWIGLVGGGLARWIGRGVWESWNTSQGFPSDLIWNIRRDKRDALWIGTGLGLVRLNRNGRIRTWTKKDGLGGANVRWLSESSDGSIWAATKPGGLARINSVSGRIRRITAKDGLPCDPEDLLIDGQDRLWLTTACGLFLNKRPSVSNQVVRVETPEAFGRAAWKILEDGRGTIWLTNRTTLWSLRNGQWRQHGRQEGIITNNPYVMALAKDGSIWMRHRYDAGIDRLEVSGDRIVQVTDVVPADPGTAQGTAFHGFDAFGNFWRGSTNGVFALSGKTWTQFTTEDGLVSNDCDGEAFWADPNGDVWMGTSSGLAHFRPQSAISFVTPTADPIIDRLEIIEPSRLMRAQLSSLSFRAEQLVHFAYRLDNAPWTDSSERSISIGGLGAGRHRLQVRSRIRDGPVSPHIAEVEFAINPIWTETWWVRALAAATALLTIFLCVQWRLRAARRKQKELEWIVAARTAKLSEANASLVEKARQLCLSEERLKNAERLAHVGHWDWDIKANKLSWSDEIFGIFGIPGACIPSWEASLQAVLPKDRERVERWIKECLAEKNGHSIEFQLLRPNGDARTVICTAEVSTDDSGCPERMLGACQDITEARRAQQEEFIRQKLESVGTLAGGIAHDFNNLLGGILTEAELIEDEMGSHSLAAEEVQTIKGLAIRGSEIVRELMTYAGNETIDSELLDLSQLVEEMLKLLRVSISKRAILRTGLDKNLPAIMGHPGQIRQVVMNLIINASEALGETEGVITVTTSLVTDTRDLLAGSAALSRTENYVLLEVSDTGSGMTEEQMSRIFDPFYTTKFMGRGLGLAVVQGVVRTHGGAIRLESTPHRGTTFRIFLPSAGQALEKGGTSEVSAREHVSGPTGTVLLVEDEDSLRFAVARMLRRRGFRVIEAADGTAAIHLLRDQEHDIDLILLDLTIPGANSQEVVYEARLTRPDAKIVITSAYGEEAGSPLLREPQVKAYIRKPFHADHLVRLLCQHL
jgi:PAS domain S-box-containing protein